MPTSKPNTQTEAAGTTATRPRSDTLSPDAHPPWQRRAGGSGNSAHNLSRYLSSSSQTVRAAARTTIFFLKVLPMLPSGALRWVTPRPVVERMTYPTLRGQAQGDLYRPATPGPHPAVVVCLGVVPFDVEHPQVPRLGEALARAGFAALLYWSPAMRDLRLDEEDIENIALAYDKLIQQPYVDPRRSGLLGTCVGGSFALMAAAHPRIRARLGFVAAFAPYAAMSTLAAGVASATRATGAGREHWPVDQLTRAVYVRSLTAELDPIEAELLRNSHAASADALSESARLIAPLLDTLAPDEAEAALRQLPTPMRARLQRLSPVTYLGDICAPLILIGHDRDDNVIPVAESRQLAALLAGRPGLRYTEFGMFQHADPTKKKLPLPRLLRELGKFYCYAYPIFRQAA